VQTLGVAIGLSVLGSLGGLLMASTLLLFDDRIRARIVPWLISYAVGTLLGAALLGLLPQALDQLPPTETLGALLGGIFTFFVLEKFVLWRHCHTEDCEVHSSAATLIVVGDALHSAVDGAIVCAAVLTSVPLGISTAIAVAAHEIPQEVGDFAVLLGAGYSRGRALALNLLSGSAAIVGAVFMFVAVDGAPMVLPYVLPFAAGNLLYVAMSDLIPDLHRGSVDASAIRQIVLVAVGILTVVWL
jgi:zinc and cadmium transporter